MIRKLGISLITLMVLWSGAAIGALEALEQVSEVSTAGISLPSSTAGQVVYRKCAGCEPAVWKVNSATSYHVGVDTPPVSLADLRAAVASNQHELIYVFYTPDTDVATRVVLSLTQASEG